MAQNKRKQAAPTDNSTFISAGLVRLRKREKLSQRGAAIKCGFPSSQWNRYETGARQPDCETLERIAAVFGVSVALAFKGKKP